MELSNQLIDPKQAAKMLGIDVPTINKLVELELLQSYKVGSYKLFTEEFIQDFIDYLNDCSEDAHNFRVSSFVG